MGKTLFALILALVPGTAWATTHGSYGDAVRAARADGNNVVVVFGAEWCRPCHELQRRIAKPEVQQALSKLHYYHVDIDKEPNLSEQFQVNRVPTTKVIKPNLEIVGSRVELMTAEEFIDLIKNPRLW